MSESLPNLEEQFTKLFDCLNRISRNPGSFLADAVEIALNSEAKTPKTRTLGIDTPQYGKIEVSASAVSNFGGSVVERLVLTLETQALGKVAVGADFIPPVSSANMLPSVDIVPVTALTEKNDGPFWVKSSDRSNPEFVIDLTEVTTLVGKAQV